MGAFTKILIANRGEIAVRIGRTAQALGYRTVAVYSEADASSLHVRVADEAVCIGPAAVSESYLCIDNIISAALRTGADAVHPGFGFLAENADFAKACALKGIVFIGPSPEVIELMGNKRAAKVRMLESGVPCVPGFQGNNESDARLIEEAQKIGFPLMAKAAAGGGGRGMRLILDGDNLAEALRSARSEAKSAFGNDELILEKAIIDPRHVEFQVFGDRHGNVIHLGERDCSVQRRHQKVVEEAPSPALDVALRRRMGEAAVAVAKAVGYVGAGTVEFLLDAQREFYFLEMNTRIQVEHPVTELVTGLDVVALQLRVASGAPLGLGQEQVELKGHAIEVRLYAEDPSTNFMPQTGRVLAWEAPAGEGIRVDHCLVQGQEVSSHYDPMLGKIIAYGKDRNEARRRLLKAVQDCVFLGVKSNQGFLAEVLSHDEFASGMATTGFIGKHFPGGRSPALQSSGVRGALAAVLFFQGSAEAAPGQASLHSWKNYKATIHTYRLKSDDGERVVLLRSLRPGQYKVSTAGENFRIELLARSGVRIRYLCNDVQSNALCIQDGPNLFLSIAGDSSSFEDLTLAQEGGQAGAGKGRLNAVMDGRIAAIHAGGGDLVKRNQTLLVMEAMKMEHPIQADMDGIVQPFTLQVGQQVKAGQLLVELSPL